MKWLPLLCALFALPAFADDAKPMALKGQPANVQIVNGKRFFSLSGVRRFTGSVDSPKALSVMHHPRAGNPIINSHGMPVKTGLAPAAGQPQTALTPTGQPMPQSTSDKILSIFSPSEQSPASLQPATR